jgi:hypothetical protein
MGEDICALESLRVEAEDIVAAEDSDSCGRRSRNVSPDAA